MLNRAALRPHPGPIYSGFPAVSQAPGWTQPKGCHPSSLADATLVMKYFEHFLRTTLCFSCWTWYSDTLPEPVVIHSSLYSSNHSLPKLIPPFLPPHLVFWYQPDFSFSNKLSPTLDPAGQVRLTLLSYHVGNDHVTQVCIISQFHSTRHTEIGSEMST